MSKLPSPTKYKGVRAIEPPDLQKALRAPTSADSAYIKGCMWLDTLAKAAYMYPGSGDWITLGSGTIGAIASVTGDSGGAIVPVAGNVDLLGTANQITVAGTAGTETWSLSATLVAPGTITSTTTITSGTGIISTIGDITASAGDIVATLGSVSAGTTVTATLGDITATDGNIVRGTAGNKDVYSSVATTTTAGANSAGTVTLSSGTATVATTAVTSASQVRLYRQGVGSTGAAALGVLTLGTIVNATSFVITAVQPADATAAQTTDVSVIAWEIVN